VAGAGGEHAASAAGAFDPAGDGGGAQTGPGAGCGRHGGRAHGHRRRARPSWPCSGPRSSPSDSSLSRQGDGIAAHSLLPALHGTRRGQVPRGAPPLLCRTCCGRRARRAAKAAAMSLLSPGGAALVKLMGENTQGTPSGRRVRALAHVARCRGSAADPAPGRPRRQAEGGRAGATAVEPEPARAAPARPDRGPGRAERSPPREGRPGAAASGGARAGSAGGRRGGGAESRGPRARRSAPLLPPERRNGAGARHAPVARGSNCPNLPAGPLFTTARVEGSNGRPQ
jgi:hypothetical protein